MCGIVGYIGSQDACPFLLTGLQRLEYRGYDSAGIATLRPTEGIRITKTAGRVVELAAAVKQTNMVGPVGIGHTRWATHGAATRENAHPHMGGNSLLTLAHNGVIENYES
ncbi:MAG: class II glutamine amidotransferase, partial [Planctomycetales bacterium]|nr:class II glutamine amidotransferase [Planctomycetales bacterium]